MSKIAKWGIAPTCHLNLHIMFIILPKSSNIDQTLNGKKIIDISKSEIDKSDVGISELHLAILVFFASQNKQWVTLTSCAEFIGFKMGDKSKRIPQEGVDLVKRIVNDLLCDRVITVDSKENKTINCIRSITEVNQSNVNDHYPKKYFELHNGVTCETKYVRINTEDLHNVLCLCRSGRKFSKKNCLFCWQLKFYFYLCKMQNVRTTEDGYKKIQINSIRSSTKIDERITDRNVVNEIESVLRCLTKEMIVDFKLPSLNELTRYSNIEIKFNKQDANVKNNRRLHKKKNKPKVEVT